MPPSVGKFTSGSSAKSGIGRASIGLPTRTSGAGLAHLDRAATCLDDARYWRDHKSFGPARSHGRACITDLSGSTPLQMANGRWARIMADAYLARIDPKIFLDWSGEGTLNAESDHRTAYIAALRAADQYDFDPLVTLVKSIAR